MPITVLNRTVGTSGFPGTLVRELRLEAQRAEEADSDGFLGGRVVALNELADYVQHHVTPDDPRLCALQAIAGAFGDPDLFQPDELGEHQAQVWYGLGRNGGGKLPSEEDLFEDFVHAGVLDLVATYGARNREDREKSSRLERRVSDAEQRADEAERELRETKAALEAATTENQQLSATLATLRPLVPSYEKGELSEGADEPATYRRRHFKEDPPGIFRTKKAHGTVAFELKVGTHPWQTFPSRETAILAAAELRGLP
jgi:hypothetical protein